LAKIAKKSFTAVLACFYLLDYLEVDRSLSPRKSPYWRTLFLTTAIMKENLIKEFLKLTNVDAESIATIMSGFLCNSIGP